MKPFFKNQYGFTLMELLVGMAIMVLIMGGIFNILSASVKSYTYAWEQGVNMQDTRTILMMLAKEIQNAKAITRRDVNSLSYTAFDGTAKTISFSNHTININGRNITNNEIDSFDFTGGTANTVTIKITIKAKAKTEVWTQTVMMLNG
jgi:prepilin-type N-terminal cleavage/methylation domain-containing protein